MTDYDVRMAGLALEMFAIALPGFVLVRVLSSGFLQRKILNNLFVMPQRR